MTHSPLPWTRRMATTDSWFIDDANGATITIISRVNRTYETPEPGVSITREVAKPHADENAALFFAAPQLLEAAEHARAFLDALLISLGEEDENYHITKEAFDHLRAATDAATTVIDGAEEAKAERARRDAEIMRLCGSGPEMQVVP